MNQRQAKRGLSAFVRHFILTSLNLLGILIVLSLIYFFPRTEIVQLAGTEVKRMDQKMFWGENIQDVRFIVARDVGSGETKMFRNQDFIWPPYFKFDSGDLSGKVMNLEEFQPKAKVLVTHYGFRVPIFSLYPNATSVQVFSDGSENRPIVFIGVLIASFVMLLYIYIYFRIRKRLPRAG